MRRGDRLWTFAVLHLVVALAILLGTLHPLRDALADRPFDLVRGVATIEALSALGMMQVRRRKGARRGARAGKALVAVGTTVVALVGYAIVFTGRSALGPGVLVGGVMLVAGWLLLLAPPVE